MATVVTNSGLSIITNLVSGLGGTVPSYVAWGTGSGTASVTDTSLFTEAAEARVDGTVTRITSSVTDDTIQVVGVMTSESGQSITNVGLFDGMSSSHLFIHADFTSVPLNETDSISFTISVTF